MTPQVGNAVDPETFCLLADRVIDEVDKVGGIMDALAARLNPKGHIHPLLLHCCLKLFVRELDKTQNVALQSLPYDINLYSFCSFVHDKRRDIEGYRNQEFRFSSGGSLVTESRQKHQHRDDGAVQEFAIGTHGGVSFLRFAI